MQHRRNTMRRNDREITEFSEMTDVMKRCDVCRLALNDEEGYPYLLPLNFGMEETDGRVTPTDTDSVAARSSSRAMSG